MERIDYLVSVGKIMLINKKKCNEESFSRLISKIEEVNPKHEFIDVIKEETKPVVAKVVEKPTKKESQLALTINNTIQFNPLKCERIYTLENFIQWLKNNNISDDDELLIRPKYSGLDCKIEVSTTDVVCYFKNKSGSIVKLSKDILKLIDFSFNKLKIGIYYGIITPNPDMWEGANLETTKEKSPLVAMYNALMQPNIEASKIILSYSSIYIYKSNFQNTLNTLLSEQLESIRSTSMSVTDYELLNSKYISDAIVLEMLDFYKEFAYVDGIIIDIDLRTDKEVKPINLDLYRDTKNLIDIEVSNVRFEMGRFGAILPVLMFNKVNYYNNSITQVILDDCKVYNEYKLSPKAKAEISIDENDYGDLIVNLSNVHESGDNFKEITSCPFCGESLTPSHKGLYCNNKNCETLQIKKLSSFFRLLGFTKMTTTLASVFYKANCVKPYDIVDLKYIDFKNICDTYLNQEDLSKLFMLCNNLKISGCELNRLQTASSCFEGVSTSQLKVFNIESIKDITVGTLKVSKEELVEMTKKWLDFIANNPFKIINV